MSLGGLLGQALGLQQAQSGQQQQLAQALAQQQATSSYYNQAVGNVYTSTTSAGTTTWICTNTATTSTTGTSGTPTLTQAQALLGMVGGMSPDIHLNDGRAHTIHFPDGTIIEVRPNGSFEIHDKDAKVVYRANRSRDFNPFLNASDKLEDFIAFCGTAGVRQDDMLSIPIKHFIAWLVIEAARADGEPEPEAPLLLPDLRPQSLPRCLSCGRFMSPRVKARKLDFCRPSCFEAKLLEAQATA